MINNTLTRPAHPFVIAAREVIAASELLRQARNLPNHRGKAAIVEACRKIYRRAVSRKDSIIEAEARDG